MRVTKAMIEAAQRGEFDFYQSGRKLGADRFIPTPKAVVRAMLEAAFAEVSLEGNKAAQPKLAVVSTQPDLATKAGDEAKPRPKLVIVTARKPTVRH